MGNTRCNRKKAFWVAYFLALIGLVACGWMISSPYRIARFPTASLTCDGRPLAGEVGYLASGSNPTVFVFVGDEVYSVDCRLREVYRNSASQMLENVLGNRFLKHGCSYGVRLGTKDSPDADFRLGDDGLSFRDLNGRRLSVSGIGPFLKEHLPQGARSGNDLRSAAREGSQSEQGSAGDAD